MLQATEMRFPPPRREKISTFFEVINFCHWQIPSRGDLIIPDNVCHQIVFSAFSENASWMMLSSLKGLYSAYVS